MSESTSSDTLSFTAHHFNYTITQWPANITQYEIWMRSVAAHLASIKITAARRLQLFQIEFKDDTQSLQYGKRRYPPERQRQSSERIYYTVKALNLISSTVAHKRGTTRVIKAAKRMKTAHEDTNRAIAALIRYGLLKSGNKYEQFRRTHRYFSQAKGTYGISTAKYPTERKVQDLAHAIYNHPDILTDSPDWVLKYRKGKLKIVGESLVLPTEQITLSQINPNDYNNEDAVVDAITKILQENGLQTQCVKVNRRGYNHPSATEPASTPDNPTQEDNEIQEGAKDATITQQPRVIPYTKNHSQSHIKLAAYVYFTSAYEARCALEPLKALGRVSLGQTIVTARVVASKVLNQVKMLLSEADGELTEAFPKATIEQLNQHIQAREFHLHLQEWIDKDGRVSFIKLKIVDPSYKIFKRGESRVAYLLEYVGNEEECRRFYPNLVDQFAECNRTTFHLNNGIALHVKLTLSSGDHKAAWTKAGRSGGHEHRDLYSDHSMASMYHLIAYQDKPNFAYKRHVHSWKKVQIDMKDWKDQQMEAKVIITQDAEKKQLHTLYRKHGRVERMPALTNGDNHEQSEVYDLLQITPLVLHNQSFCCLTTLGLGLEHIVKEKSKRLKQLKGRYQGLVDGFGTTKCATSGTGIRHLINDCLRLTPDTKPSLVKYAPIWYLMDAICHHMHIKGGTPEGQHLALLDPERLTFNSTTFLWWILIGDLSEETGRRTLKTCTKNHLEDKIYAYELVCACPEWEEHLKLPVSLIDESIFEASFSPRDEMINAFRSKVALERERMTSHFKTMINQVAPMKQYRSIMSGLSRHLRHNIIIRNCWQGLTKWSFNIRTGFLPRMVQYSFRDRITLSDSNDIYLDLKGPIDPFFPADASLADIIIDPCGQCDQLPDPVPVPPRSTFTRTLRVWWLWLVIKRNWTRHILLQSYPKRLKEGHLNRANAYLTTLRTQCQLPHSSWDATEMKTLYDAYTLYYQKYPTDLIQFKPTRAFSNLMQKTIDDTNKQLDFWDGNTSSLPYDVHDIKSDRTWNKDKLKSVLRYFQLHGNHHKSLTRLGGTKSDLQQRVIPLLIQFKIIDAIPDEAPSV